MTPEEFNNFLKEQIPLDYEGAVKLVSKSLPNDDVDTKFLDAMFDAMFTAFNEHPMQMMPLFNSKYPWLTFLISEFFTQATTDTQKKYLSSKIFKTFAAVLRGLNADASYSILKDLIYWLKEVSIISDGNLNQEYLDLLRAILNKRLISKIATNSDVITTNNFLKIVQNASDSLRKIAEGIQDPTITEKINDTQERIIKFYTAVLSDKVEEIEEEYASTATKDFDKRLYYKEIYQKYVNIALESLNLARSIMYTDEELNKILTRMMFLNIDLNNIKLAEDFFSLNSNSLAKYKGKIPEDIKKSISEKWHTYFGNVPDIIDSIIDVNLSLVARDSDLASTSDLFQKNDNFCTYLLQCVKSDISDGQIEIMAENGMYHSIMQSLQNGKNINAKTAYTVCEAILENKQLRNIPINFSIINMLLDALQNASTVHASASQLLFSTTQNSAIPPENLHKLALHIFLDALKAGDEQIALRILDKNLLNLPQKNNYIQFALELGAFTVARVLNKKYQPDENGVEFLEKFPIAKAILSLSDDDAKRLFESIPDEYCDAISSKLMLKPMLINESKTENEIFDYFTLLTPKYLNLTAYNEEDRPFITLPGISFTDDKMILKLKEHPYTKVQNLTAGVNVSLEKEILNYLKHPAPSASNKQ